MGAWYVSGVRRVATLVALVLTNACARTPPPGQDAAPHSPTLSPAPAPAPDSSSPAPTPPSPTPPAGLACLARHYVGTPQHDAAGWALVLPDGARLPWDDGRTKTFEQTLDAPDLQDVFSIPYRTGAIVPITTPDDDPGRVRADALFKATYGASEAEVRKQLVPWKFRGKSLVVHRRALAAFEKVGARLDALLAKDPSLAPFFDGMGGTFNWRVIAGTTRASSHSYGVSLDLNPARSHYWRNEPKGGWKNGIPQSIVDAFEAEGFVWGGRWFHYDTMHFEWRPELLDPTCR